MDTTEKKIVEARIVPCVPAQAIFQAKVIGRLEGEQEMKVILEYYSDEISFSEREVVGKTPSEVNHLKFLKDKAYLQS